jgi:DNA-binding PadR family transcriptional regulator
MPPLMHVLDVLTLVAVARLGDDAYGVTVREDIAAVTGRDVSMAAVYAALDRLTTQRLVSPWQSEPRAERGGRARRHFAVTAAGKAALRAERETTERLWRGVPPAIAARRR